MKFFDKRKPPEESTLDSNQVDNSYNKSLLKEMYKLNRPDFLLTRSVEELLMDKGDGKTYLDYILECFINGININLSEIKIDETRMKASIKAKLYLKFAEYDLLNYLPKLKADDFVNTKENGKSLLEYLLEYNQRLTIDRLLTNSVLKNERIQLYLKAKGIDINSKKTLDVIDDDLIETYHNYYNGKLKDLNTDEEFESLLINLKNLLQRSVLSERKLVELIIILYRLYYQNNREYARIELQNLITVLNNNTLRVVYGDDNYYNGLNRTITMSSDNIYALGHELGHACFDLISNTIPTEEYSKLCLELREDKEIVKRLDYFSKLYSKKYLEVVEKVEKSWSKQDHIKQKTDSEIEDFLSMSKLKQYLILINIGFDDKKADELVSSFYTKEDYLKSFEEIRKKQLADSYFRREYAHICAVADSIDAVFLGKFYDEKIETDDSRKIKQCVGHGTYYYNSLSQNPLNEAMANYMQILKSPDCEEGIKLFKAMLGDKYVQLMEKIYYETIINSSIVNRKSR